MAAGLFGELSVGRLPGVLNHIRLCLVAENGDKCPANIGMAIFRSIEGLLSDKHMEPEKGALLPLPISRGYGECL